MKESCFFLILGHALDEGFIIKHWMPAASFLRALTHLAQDGVKCNPLLCILRVCVKLINSTVIFPLLVHFYSWFLPLVFPLRVYVGTWRLIRFLWRNDFWTGCVVKENSLVANVNLFHFSQSTLMFDLCTVKSGDDRHSALCQDICHAEI